MSGAERPGIEPIAGITPADLGNQPAFEFKGAPIPPSYALQLVSDAADLAVKREFASREKGARGEGYDLRLAELPLRAEQNGQPVGPAYEFLVTWQLLQDVAQAPPSLTRSSLLGIALSQGRDAVRPDFERDAINDLNACYYGSPGVAFSPEGGVATLYANLEPLNNAIGAALVATTHTDNQSLRVKELASGIHSDHWQHIAKTALQRGALDIDVTLTDFVTPPIETEHPSDGLTVHAEKYSLLEDMPNLSPEDRYNAMLATYAFDSVWLPGDMSLERHGDQWYENLYRVKAAEWNRYSDMLIEAMRQGHPFVIPDPLVFDGVAVELAQQPVDLSDHPYGQYIEEYGEDIINFPGGLIHRVVNAFENQLTENGTFLNGDVGYFGGKRSSMPSRPGLTGVGARYREDDFVIAKTILEQEHGLNVSLYRPLRRFVETYLGKDWHKQTDRYTRRLVRGGKNIRGNGLMIVTR